MDFLEQNPCAALNLNTNPQYGQDKNSAQCNFYVKLLLWTSWAHVDFTNKAGKYLF